MNRTTPAAPPDEARMNGAAWAALIGAALLLLLCLAQVIYRFGLPSDGWTVPYDVSTGAQRYVFTEYLGTAPTPLQSGDVLAAIEGQPIADLVGRALRFNPQRPAAWQVGGTVQYTVLRDGQPLDLPVTLMQRPLWPSLRAILVENLRSLYIVLQLLIAVFVFARRPAHHAARLLLVVSAAVMAFGLSVPLEGQAGGTATLFYRAAYWPAWIFNALIYPLLIVPLLPHLFLVMPVAKAPMRRWPRLSVGLLYGLPAAWLAVNLLPNLNQPLQFWRALVEVGSATIFPLSMLVTGVSLVHTFVTERDLARRAQARWLALGVLVGYGFGQGALFFLPELGLLPKGPVIDLLVIVTSVIYPISIAIAVLRYRLFDVDLIIRRTLIYAALTAALAFVYFGSVVVLQNIFRAFTGETSQLAVVASTLAIAALFNPLRHRLQEFIDRRFYRRKYDAALTLAQFGATARDETDLDQLTGRLVDVVEDTVQPAHVSLWLADSQAGGDE